MFVCLTCGKKFNTEEDMQKHFLPCWKSEHPFHQSKSAPYSGETTTREVNEDIMNFFNSFGGK